MRVDMGDDWRLRLDAHGYRRCDRSHAWYTVAMSATSLTSVAIRLPASLLVEVDAEVERLRELLPGSSVSRADAVRSLLSAGILANESSASKVTASRTQRARLAVLEVQSPGRWTLKKLSELTGVSYSTLAVLVRGGLVSTASAEKIAKALDTIAGTSPA